MLLFVGQMERGFAEREAYEVDRRTLGSRRSGSRWTMRAAFRRWSRVRSRSRSPAGRGPSCSRSPGHALRTRPPADRRAGRRALAHPGGEDLARFARAARELGTSADAPRRERLDEGGDRRHSGVRGADRCRPSALRRQDLFDNPTRSTRQRRPRGSGARGAHPRGGSRPRRRPAPRRGRRAGHAPRSACAAAAARSTFSRRRGTARLSAELPIVAGMPQFAAAAPARALDGTRRMRWARSAAGDQRLGAPRPPARRARSRARSCAGCVPALPDDAIVTNGAGNCRGLAAPATSRIENLGRSSRRRTERWARRSAAIAAKLVPRSARSSRSAATATS